MHRGSLVVAILSLFGAVAAFVIAAELGDPRSLYVVIGIVLLANAAVRYRLARRGLSRPSADAGPPGAPLADAGLRGTD